MPKKKNNKAASPNWRGMNARITNEETRLRQARESGHRGLTKSLDRVYNELASTTKGSRQRLTRGNQRDLAKIKDALRRQEQANRRVVTRTQKANAGMGDVGGMMAGTYQAAAAPAKTAATTARKTGKAVQEAEKSSASRSQVILDIIESSQQEMQAASQYQANRALADRAQADANQIAAQRHEIAMARLNYKLQQKQMQQQLEAERKQMMWQQKQAEKALGTQTFGTLRPQIDTMVNISDDILRLRADNPSMSQAEVIQWLVDNGRIAPEDATAPAVTNLVRTLTTNTQAGNDLDNLADELLMSLNQQPEWQTLSKKQKDKLRNLIKTQASTINISRALQETDVDEPGGGFLGGVIDPTPDSPGEALIGFAEGALGLRQ